MSYLAPVTRVAKALGLKERIVSVAALARRVESGLPKASLHTAASLAVADASERASLMNRIVPSATFKRRTALSHGESERTERLARVVATAQYVFDDERDARLFLSTPHPELEGARPLDVALSEIGAHRVEEVLARLFHGLPA